MSQSDKQLDILSGEKIVKVDWPKFGEPIDIGLLRVNLMHEIDAHDHRVPFDLRDVKGAPPELVNLLVELKRYCVARSKIMSTAWMQPPLRDAFAQAAQRPAIGSVAPSADPDSEQASHTADELLKAAEKEAGYDISKAKKVGRKVATRKAQKRRQRLIRLGATSLVAGAAVIAVMAFVLFLQDEPPVPVPEKIYENQNPSQASL